MSELSLTNGTNDGVEVVAKAINQTNTHHVAKRRKGGRGRERERGRGERERERERGGGRERED